MWRALMSSRFASWVVARVSLPKPRQVQHELDLQRLYILTQVARAGAARKQVNMHALILKSQSLEPPTVRAEVEEALARQVVGLAEALHEELTQAGDPALAAAGMTAAHDQIERRRARESSGLSKLIKSIRGGGAKERREQEQARGWQAAEGPGVDRRSGGGSSSSSDSDSASGEGASLSPSTSGASADGSGGCGSSSSSSSSRNDDGSGGGSSSSGSVMSQAALAAALRRRTGFALELRPSTVPHPEAGTGLFLAGEARAGTVVALFPGVLYGRTQLVHMPNYPKVDTNNPYLSCRYDQSIVDSKPWGRGDPGVVGASSGTSGGGTGAGPAAAAAAGQHGGASGGGGSGGGGSGGGPPAEEGEVVAPWWTWAGPLSTSLGCLEGRHPLALGHFVNHPGAGQSPNVLEASLDLPLDDPALASRPWLRAYLPSLQPPLHYDPFNKKGGGEDGAADDDDDDKSDDEEDDEDDERRRKKAAAAAATRNAGVAGSAAAVAVPAPDSTGTRNGAAMPPPAAAVGRPGPGELRPRALLAPPGGVLRLLVLVATRGMRDGEELLQNYRMNPHVVRPDWYVVHDAEAEQRRWAKIHALDLGFSKGKPPAAAATGPGAGEPTGGSAGGKPGGAAGG